MAERCTPDEARAALAAVKNFLTAPKRRAFTVHRTTPDSSHVCRICGVCQFRNVAMIKYSVRSYACTSCFIADDATSVLAMPSHVINGTPLCDFDGFKREQLDETHTTVQRILARVWKKHGRHESLDVEALHALALEREAAAELLRSGRADGVLADGAPR